MGDRFTTTDMGHGLRMQACLRLPLSMQQAHDGK